MISFILHLTIFQRDKRNHLCQATIEGEEPAPAQGFVLLKGNFCCHRCLFGVRQTSWLTINIPHNGVRSLLPSSGQMHYSCSDSGVSDYDYCWPWPGAKLFLFILVLFWETSLIYFIYSFLQLSNSVLNYISPFPPQGKLVKQTNKQKNLWNVGCVSYFTYE